MTRQFKWLVGFSVASTVLLLLAWNVHRTLSRPFFFANIREGQRLSGDLTIVATTDGSTAPSLILWMDGKEYAGCPMHQEADHWYSDFSLRTSAYANGPHVLEIKLGHTVFDTRHVVFQNDKYFK